MVELLVTVLWIALIVISCVSFYMFFVLIRYGENGGTEKDFVKIKKLSFRVEAAWVLLTFVVINVSRV